MVSDSRSILRVAQGKQGQPSAVILDGRTLQSTCESVPIAGYDGYKRKRGSKVHMAVDALGHLLAVQVTPANEQESAQVRALVQEVQHATGETVKLRLHRRRPGRSRAGVRHRTARRKAAGSQEGLCAAAAPLGRGAQFRLGQSVPALGP